MSGTTIRSSGGGPLWLFVTALVVVGVAGSYLLSTLAPNPRPTQADKAPAVVPSSLTEKPPPQATPPSRRPSIEARPTSAPTHSVAGKAAQARAYERATQGPDRLPQRDLQIRDEVREALRPHVEDCMIKARARKPELMAMVGVVLDIHADPTTGTSIKNVRMPPVGVGEDQAFQACVRRAGAKLDLPMFKDPGRQVLHLTFELEAN